MPGKYRTRSVNLRRTYEHVLVMEASIGRSLRDGEVVHHIDGDPRNNQIENLLLCPSQGAHLRIHAEARVRAAGGEPAQHRICCSCNQLKDKAEYTTNKNTWDGRHPQCRTCSNECRRGKGYSKWSPRRAEQQRQRRRRRK